MLVSTYLLYISYLMVASFKRNNHFISVKIKFLTAINLCLIIFWYVFYEFCTKTRLTSLKVFFFKAYQIECCNFLYVLFHSFAFFLLTFGRNVLISREFSSALFHYENSFELVFMYGMINLYVYTLAFMYSPAKFIGR